MTPVGGQKKNQKISQKITNKSQDLQTEAKSEGNTLFLGNIARPF